MNVNEKKFIDVFVDLIDDGRNISSNDNLEYRYKNVDIEKYIKEWESFLFDKMDELDENAYDEWLANLEFDTISERELTKYGLPVEKIQLVSVDGQYFIKGCHNVLSKAYKEMLSICGNKDNDLYFAYSASPRVPHMLYFVVAIFDGGDVKIFRKLKNVLNDAENEIIALCKDFTNSQENFSVKPSFDTYTSDTYIDENKMTEQDIQDKKDMLDYYSEGGVVNFKALIIDDSSVLYKKTAKVDESTYSIEKFLDKMFKCIPETFIENRPDDRSNYI